MSDLGPIIAAVLGPMLLFIVATMRYQHVDSTKTRELITKSIETANKENRKLTDRNRDLIESAPGVSSTNKENRKLTDRNRDLIETFPRRPTRTLATSSTRTTQS